jgi:hypothetical protein
MAATLAITRAPEMLKLRRLLVNLSIAIPSFAS